MKKGFGNLIIIVIGALLIIGGGYFIYSSNSTNNTVRELSKENWISYENEKYDVSLSFPANFKFSLQTVEKRSGGGTSSRLIESSNSNINSDNFLTFFVYESDIDPSSYKTYRKTEKIELENLKGKIRYREMSAGRFIDFASPNFEQPQYELQLGAFTKSETDEKVEIFKNILTTIDYN